MMHCQKNIKFDLIFYKQLRLTENTWK